MRERETDRKGAEQLRGTAQPDGKRTDQSECLLVFL